MDSKLLGALGEQTAARYLRENGYEILSANFRTRVGELDIVAKKDKTIHFVEVKTRKKGTMLPPRAAVDKSKEQNIIDSAGIYMKTYDLKMKRRFDIIEVVTDGNSGVVSVNFIEGAF